MSNWRGFPSPRSRAWPAFSWRPPRDDDDEKIEKEKRMKTAAARWTS